MATSSTVKNQLANRKNAAPVQKDNSIQGQLQQAFAKQFKAIQSIVPKHVTPERLVRIGLNAVSRTPKLLECTQESIIGAVINCATLGLEPNLMGHAYLVPFYNGKTKKMEAQFQIGYRGLIDLARRTGQLSVVYAREVYEGDKFEFAYGLEPKLIHEPCGEDDESKVTHFYAVYKLNDGGFDFIVMSRRQVEKHRDRFTKSQKNGQVFGPWSDHFIEMAKKTVLIKALKTAPISIEQQENQQIMEGINRDSSISKVKEDPANLGGAFIDAEYTVNDTAEEAPSAESAEKKEPLQQDFGFEG
ncbi:recombinase RecT [Pseudobacillus badius]|uniref:recombinase RecT n=1 Tax=Bacillus badius TaxID=1455 RepID=UPI0024A5B964|nr:recombinase RecT [Bacillus badius]GLY10361.1 DNA recombination protein RecT [Bacillus badius]